jgi:hypothetical protein
MDDIFTFDNIVNVDDKIIKNLISGGLIPRPLGRFKLGVWGICSPTYAKISRRNLQYPAALPRGFFIMEIR